jgi:hypothetical protein
VKQQNSFLPIQITDVVPPERTTAKLKMIGISEIGVKYALKTLTDDPVLPLTEWFCYSLCRLTGIATPDFDVVKMPDGSLAFGSKWEPPSTFIADPSGSDKEELMLRLFNTADGLSQMLTLDCFLPNKDRHFGNIMFKPQQRSQQVLAFDWSELNCVKNCFLPEKLADKSNTISTITVLIYLGKASNKNYLSSKKITDYSNRIKEISSKDISIILHTAPVEWHNGIDINGIIAWWNPANVALRLTEALEKLP